MSDIVEQARKFAGLDNDIPIGLALEMADEIERLRERLRRIADWADAYPIDVFPEPDLEKARDLLKAGGQTLDAVSASAMRHILTELQKMGLAEGDR